MVFFSDDGTTMPTLGEAIRDMATAYFTRLRMRTLSTSAAGWSGSPRCLTGSFTTPAGMVQLCLKASTQSGNIPTLVVQQLYVPEASRGRGVCRTLLRSTIPDLATRAGFTQVLVHCSDNEPLRAVLLGWGTEQYTECSFGMFYKALSNVQSLQWGEPLVETPTCVVLQKPPSRATTAH
ncbi:hypothetical protein JKP88DRAFT_243909 [Tribonema minus]|uniref:Uncharacterized protein n=1 Tax=Tribonema minus TaxID=303371 RepID=A0A835Z549_9STRA|nr:hypothetical protein JKP88DRAFT_243909 [Tribonema minus]